GRLRLVRARVERGGGGDDLERRAGDEQAVGRAVDQRRGGAALRILRAALDLSEVALDEARVVAWSRCHHEHTARAWFESDRGAAVAVERLQRGALGLRP